MVELAFFVNRLAGGGRAGRVWSRLMARQPALGAAPRVDTADPTLARQHLRELLRQGVRRLVVVGGDGTLQHALDALLEQGPRQPVSVGLVPAGGGSDLARGLGLRRSPAAALKRALRAPARPVDVIRLRCGEQIRYAANIASFGLGGEVAEAVNRLPRPNRFSYFNAALRALRHYAPARARISLDGEPWYEGPLLLLAVANGRAFGGGMRIAPHAEADDGLAEVVLVRPAPLWQLLPRLPYLYLGIHLGLSFVRCAPARRVRIEPLGAHPPYELDGEPVAMEGPVELEVLPGALQLAM